MIANSKMASLYREVTLLFTISGAYFGRRFAMSGACIDPARFIWHRFDFADVARSSVQRRDRRHHSHANAGVDR
jgi:hypothetical protein